MADIILDSRETKLYNSINNRDIDDIKNNINISSKQLDIGDINIKYEEIDLIFERKTISDLLSSLKDGRLHEQKYRLLENYNSQNITYIIEGDDIISSKNFSNQNILSGIYYHTLYRDGIHIVYTKNIEETTTFILLLANKCFLNPSKFKRKENSTYIDNIKTKTKKIENITKDNCYVLQLCQIPNISKTIAQNIANKYKTFRDLIKALDESDNKKELLCNINKIGELKATKILEYLNYLDTNEELTNN